MPSHNRIVVASAGSGKTTTMIDCACAEVESRAALVTYTLNNTSSIERMIYEAVGSVPPHVKISTWYCFLLRHLIRPYQNALYREPVKMLYFHDGISAQYCKESDTARHYFGSAGSIYVDKVSKFACQVIKKTDGMPLRRLERIFDHLFVDEVQDLAGYDLDLIENILRSRIRVTLIGDHRQATFSTNSALKNRKYAGSKIIDKFAEWEKEGLCELEFRNISHRCVQPICRLADRLHPELPTTTSMNTRITGHDGVFALRERDVEAYLARFSPQTLRYNRTFKDVLGQPINFGAAKGLTFDRTLIFPHGPFQKFLLTEDPNDAGKDLAKIYVAITRARQSVAIVIKDHSKPPLIPIFEF